MGLQHGARMQQLKSEAALRRLHEQQAAETLRYAIWQHNQAIDEQADNAKRSAVFQSMITPTLTVPAEGPPMAGGPTPTAQVANPGFVENMGEAWLLANKGNPNMGKVMTEAGALMLNQARLKEAAQGPHQPSTGRLTTPSGREIEFFQGSKNSAQPIYSPEMVNLTDLNTGKQVSVIQTGNSAKTVPQDIESRQIRVDDLKRLKEAPGGAKLLEYDEKVGGFTLPPQNAEAARELLSGATQISQPVRTALEKQQVEVGKVFALGKQLAPLLTPDNVGVRGMANRAFEGVAAQLVPGFKISKATDTVAVAKEFQAALIKGLKSDFNIAEPERKTLEVAFPTPQNWFEGAPQSKSKLATSLENWGTISRSNAQALGKPITPQWLTRDEIRQKLGAKEIDLETANNLMEDNGWALIESLRAEALR